MQDMPIDTQTNGNYIAAFFTFRDAKYKHWREVDFEITGDTTGSVNTNVLYGEDTNVWVAEMGEPVPVEVSANVRADFHTYAMEWLPDKVTWYFDGEPIRNYTGEQVPIPSLSSKVMMNTWIFQPAFGGKEIENNRYPMQTEYDWFRFYKWDGDAQYPCAGMTTDCLTDDDWYLSSNNPCDGIAQSGTVYGEPPCIATCNY